MTGPVAFLFGFSVIGPELRNALVRLSSRVIQQSHWQDEDISMTGRRTSRT